MQTDGNPLQLSSSHLHSLSFSISPKQFRVQQGRAPRPNNNYPQFALEGSKYNSASAFPKDDKGYLHLVLHAVKVISGQQRH